MTSTRSHWGAQTDSCGSCCGAFAFLVLICPGRWKGEQSKLMAQTSAAFLFLWNGSVMPGFTRGSYKALCSNEEERRVRGEGGGVWLQMGESEGEMRKTRRVCGWGWGGVNISHHSRLQATHNVAMRNDTQIPSNAWIVEQNCRKHFRCIL